MPSLAETQAAVRAAVVASHPDAIRPLIHGGHDAERRLGIHTRHYHASLITTLRGRFPATGWLVGDEAVNQAAASFVVAHPPRVVCMAEFGAMFPAWLAGRPGLQALKWLEPFATLEWEIGRVAVSISSPPLDLTWLQTQDPDALGAATLDVQSGTAWLAVDHNIDDLMRAFLSGAPPDQFALVSGCRWIEVSGSRGETQLRSLQAGHWTFRRALAHQHTIEEAAGAALDADPACDPGQALVYMIADGLIAAPRVSNPE